MFKLTNPLKLKKIAAGTLAVVLAGSFTFAGTNVFADTTTSNTSVAPETPTTVSVTTGNTSGTVTDSTSTSTTPASASNGTTENTSASAAGVKTSSTSTSPDSITTTSSSSSTDTGTTAAVAGTTSQETPSLVPGDFFYFAKILFEKIQLALTFNQTNKAKLLASDAAERLAEAQVLYASGSEQKAVDTVQTSLDDLNSAQKIVDNQDTEKKDSQEIDDTKAPDQSNQTAQSSDRSQNTALDNQVSPVLTALKAQISQNILALQKALEKGHKSDKAKKQLEKNIEKFMKMFDLEKINNTSSPSPQDTNTNGTTADTSAPADATTNDTTIEPASDSNSMTTASVSTTSDVTAAPATTNSNSTVAATPASTGSNSVAPMDTQITSGTANKGENVSTVTKRQISDNHGEAVSKFAKQKGKEMKAEHSRENDHGHH